MPGEPLTAYAVPYDYYARYNYPQQQQQQQQQPQKSYDRYCMYCIANIKRPAKEEYRSRSRSPPHTHSPVHLPYELECYYRDLVRSVYIKIFFIG